MTREPERQQLALALVSWFRATQRDLPWRRTRDPYAIWVSEIMLQQTRVQTVIPYYTRFLEAFPSVVALAEAPQSEVLARWSGLGYYRRARMLQQAARVLTTERGGALPSDAASLERVPGIGPYTAGAIASIAFHQATPIVDGNVARVLARLFAIRQDVGRGAGRARVWSLAKSLVEQPAAAEDPGAFNQSLMELGALVCTPREPGCDGCPVRSVCEAQRLGCVGELPLVVSKSAPRHWPRVALLAKGASGVLLARRASDALMGGMWEPPMIDAGDDPNASARSLAALVGARVSRLHDGGTVKHVLTHRRITVQVIGATLASRRLALSKLPAEYDDVTVASDYAALPMSVLARKLLG